MQYKFMIPDQIREAIKKNTPVVLAIGNLEYHSGHLPLGTDALVIEGCLNKLEERRPETVVLPPFYYGTSSHAVSGPENGKGNISIDSMTVCRLAEELFTDLLEVGFRNIHGFVYHQSENFHQGMPMDLAFRFAGRRAIFAYQERVRGRGWWGNPQMRNYYDDPDANLFDWIQIHPAVDDLTGEKFGSDHAGKIETSALMALYPDTVHPDKHLKDEWFAEDALQATAELGKAYINSAVDALENLLYGK